MGNMARDSMIGDIADEVDFKAVKDRRVSCILSFVCSKGKYSSWCLNWWNCPMDLQVISKESPI